MLLALDFGRVMGGEARLELGRRERLPGTVRRVLLPDVRPREERFGVKVNCFFSSVGLG